MALNDPHQHLPLEPGRNWILLEWSSDVAEELGIVHSAALRGRSCVPPVIMSVDYDSLESPPVSPKAGAMQIYSTVR